MTPNEINKLFTTQLTEEKMNTAIEKLFLKLPKVRNTSDEVLKNIIYCFVKYSRFDLSIRLIQDLVKRSENQDVISFVRKYQEAMSYFFGVLILQFDQRYNVEISQLIKKFYDVASNLPTLQVLQGLCHAHPQGINETHEIKRHQINISLGITCLEEAINKLNKKKSKKFFYQFIQLRLAELYKQTGNFEIAWKLESQALFLTDELTTIEKKFHNFLPYYEKNLEDSFLLVLWMRYAEVQYSGIIPKNYQNLCSISTELPPPAIDHLEAYKKKIM